MIEQAVPAERMQRLLDAVSLVGSELELQVVLRSIAQVAADLVDARYGALGVLAPDGSLAQFVTVGLDDAQTAAIGARPLGFGILGELIRHPVPLRTEDLGAHPAAVGFPPGHPPMHSFLGVPVRVHGKVFGNLYLTDKRSGQFDADDEALVAGLAAAVGISVDNARLYERARRRERAAAAAGEITTSLLSGAEPEVVLELIAERAADLLGADVGLIALQHADRLLVEVSWGATPRALLSTDGPIAALLGADELCVLDRLVALELWPDAAAGPALAVPLGGGILVAARPSSGLRFVDEELLSFAEFAGQATVALELAQRRRDAERLSVFSDRDRIARDLHDRVIQRLFATGMQLQSTVGQIGEAVAQQRVRQAVDDLDETVRQIRQTIYGLGHDQLVPAPGVRRRVLELMDTAEELLGFLPRSRVTGPLDVAVPADAAEHLLSVLREALTNVARHSAASEVSVEIDVGETLSLQVLDNGIGLFGDGRRSGLGNLEERAVLLGGHFEVRNREEGGTALTWEVPLSSSASPGASR
ncbi:MAG: GAF domain-containing protein [Mycobacteriales bacterium]